VRVRLRVLSLTIHARTHTSTRSTQGATDDCGRTALAVAELALRRAPDVDDDVDGDKQIDTVRACVRVT
jgi:hypothetical protein